METECDLTRRYSVKKQNKKMRVDFVSCMCMSNFYFLKRLAKLATDKRLGTSNVAAWADIPR